MAILNLVLPILRLFLAVCLLLASLLAVFKPPINVLWKLAIAVQECGHYMVLPCLLLAWLGFRAGFSGAAASGIFFAAALLFASPLLRAMTTAHRLEKNFSEGFGKAVPGYASPFRASTLDWKQLLTGVPLPEAKPKTLYYASRDSIRYALDFYPTARPHAPCVVVVHGGGWDSGDRTQLEPLNRFLVAEGYAVASVDYRLAPKYQYPAPVEDVDAALAYLRRNAGELGIDSANLVLLGRSAGGQIALQAAYQGARGEGIRGVIAFYAPGDMVYGYSIPCNPLILDSRKLMEVYLGGSYSQVPANYVASSPIEALRAGSPPTLLLHGHPDVLVSYQHTVHMDAKLNALGVPHFIVDLPWATHGFDYFFSGPGSQISLYFIERFLAKVTQ